jgi:hypothetical protein
MLWIWVKGAPVSLSLILLFLIKLFFINGTTRICDRFLSLFFVALREKFHFAAFGYKMFERHQVLIAKASLKETMSSTQNASFGPNNPTRGDDLNA